MMKQKIEKTADEKMWNRISRIPAVILVLLSGIDIVRFAILGDKTAFITFSMIAVTFMLVAYMAWKSKMPFLYLVIAAAAFVLYFNTNFSTSTYYFNWLFLVESIIAAKYDAEESEQAGTVEEVVYDTKAYATDERDVKKTAYVYLPYGYSEEKEYNILYLMHGTGDDEKYWLKTNPYNKTMLDNMIADGDIEPLIVVTPTFYVEDDCADDLDQLTYSFAKELRNDLMPEIESVYSTYAKSADDEGFAESRDHRAFAGLSRGAVTMYHSALCQSLDYFSWFGAFSGSRTDKTAFEDTIQTSNFAELPIHYLYVASGNFDFALPGQVQDYQALLDIEPRLRSGVNTCFDVFPMRYHSMGNWHLALYNFLQKIF